MLRLILIAASMLQDAPYRELRVGDVIDLASMRDRPVYASPQSEQPAPVASLAVPFTVPAAPAVVPTDPYGFTAWLNAARAAHGLGAVGYDVNLSNWAANNNGQQQRRGMGHYVMGPARRQNSGWGSGSAVWSMWLNEPRNVWGGLHRDALLDPTITTIGISQLGMFWTFSAY